LRRVKRGALRDCNMPELPEVETIRLELQKQIVGKTVFAVEIYEKKSFIGKIEDVLRAKITDILRRGKLMRVMLENGRELQIHLRMTGQIGICRKSDKKLRFERVRIDFADESLRFSDMRKFGYVKVVKQEDFKDDKFGIEPLTSGFTLPRFKELILRSKKPIKTFLLDQNLIAGLGNIYASESLFKAGINPFRMANALINEEIEKLHQSIEEILKFAILKKGSSMKDKMYVQVSGESGEYQKHFLVYEKAGQKCGVCGSIIKKERLGGRGTYFCSVCQK
jgi:formamidopyrimidine-DNA glycosylase